MLGLWVRRVGVCGLPACGRLSPTPVSVGRNRSSVSLQFLPETRDFGAEAGAVGENPTALLAKRAPSVHSGWGEPRGSCSRVSSPVWAQQQTFSGEPAVGGPWKHSSALHSSRLLSFAHPGGRRSRQSHRRRPLESWGAA